MRVYELAKEFDINSKELIAQLNEIGVPIKNHLVTLTDEQCNLIRTALQVPKKKKTPPKKELVSKGKKPEKPKPVDEKPSKPDVEPEQAEKKVDKGDVVEVFNMMTIKEFSNRTDIDSNQIIKKLMEYNIMATINYSIDMDTIEILAEEYDINIKKEEFYGENILKEDDIDDKEYQSRPPIVTVMGHVDHGKTSLLDAIRKTNVVASEAGAITQHIGAHVVDLKEGRIIYLDTPGHSAFTGMRARGANVTDIVVLVVAADEGVKPQTIEAINHSRAADVPIIVAINKIDKPTANADRVMQELGKQNLIPEQWGGDIIMIPVSAVTKENVDTLLENILLQAEMMELKTYYDHPARGTVIESKLDKRLGAVATILIIGGTVKVGDYFVCGNEYGKVRVLIDTFGNRVTESNAQMPVEVVGLNGVPSAGDEFAVVEEEKVAKDISNKRKLIKRERDHQKKDHVTLENLFSKIEEGNIADLKIILKADVNGSEEVLKESLLNLSNDKVKINIIHSSVGEINENDIMLAAASDAIVIGFNVNASSSIRSFAEKEKIQIRVFRVIYNVINTVKEAMSGLLEPTYEEQIIGEADVREVFNITKVGNIAGCYVESGKINRNHRIRVIRNGRIIHEGTLSSLKHLKENVREANSGYECGIGIANYNDIKIGDKLQTYQMVEKKSKMF